MADSITCPVCSRTSTDPNDVRERYCGHCHIHHEDLLLPVHVVYLNPSDYPTKFVVRAQYVTRNGVLVAHNPEVVTDSIEEARRTIPPGLVPMMPHPNDDPTIVETWF